MRELGERRPPRVTEPEQFRGLVEGFPGGVVQGFAQQFVVADARHAHELSVAPRNQQRDKREGRCSFFQQWRKQMPLEMMHADRPDSETEREAVRDGRAHEQRSCKAGALGVSDRVQVRLLDSGSAQDLADQREQPPNVVPRRELRYDAPVCVVQRHLRMQGVSEQAAVAVVDGHPGFVAGGFDAQDKHDFSVLFGPSCQPAVSMFL